MLPSITQAYCPGWYITSINEFVKLINTYSDSYKKVSIPILILHGKEDTIVPVESSINVYEKLKSKNKKLILLDSESHDLFRNEASPAISCVENFLK